jgi:O-antigen/teichoic acid export membrane protein
LELVALPLAVVAGSLLLAFPAVRLFGIVGAGYAWLVANALASGWCLVRWRVERSEATRDATGVSVTVQEARA